MRAPSAVVTASGWLPTLPYDCREEGLGGPSRDEVQQTPISTYLVGVAYAPLPRADRLDRIRALAGQLDVEAR